MRIFGIIVISLGIAACLLTIVVAQGQMFGDYRGLNIIAMSIAAVGIVGAAAVVLRNSGPK